MKRLAALAVALTVALAACAPPAPAAGIVRDKEYEGPSTIFVSQCSGNPMVCTQIPIMSGPSWSLRLVDGDREGWRDVDPAEYNACRVGMRFPECAKGA